VTWLLPFVQQPCAQSRRCVTLAISVVGSTVWAKREGKITRLSFPNNCLQFCCPWMSACHITVSFSSNKNWCPVSGSASSL
jgi:hypothetical protein